MPSPFPGMDPYLEAPGLWPDVHHGLISEMQAALNRRLRPKYHVRVEERVYISDENDPGREVIVPDLRVAETREPHMFNQSPETGGVGVAEPVVLTTLIDDEIHEARLEVVDSGQHLVVTVIEVLSPTNKVAGSRGRASYEEKRREVMTSPSHFVEIDLLRAGVPIHCRELLPKGDYFVHVSRKDRGEKGGGYLLCEAPSGPSRQKVPDPFFPILLTQRLPVVSIPLKPEDPDAQLDLQAVLNTAYDRAAYDLEIDYRSDPVPPLLGEYADWADGLLKSKGRR